MIKKAIVLFMTVLFVCMPLSSATPTESDNAQIALDAIRYMQAETLPNMHVNDPVIIRGAYVITLPEDRSAMNAVMSKEYEPFTHVVVVEYGYYGIPPFLSGLYLSAGMAADGTYSTCVPPDWICSRAFDMTVFEKLDIEVMDAASLQEALDAAQKQP